MSTITEAVKERVGITKALSADDMSQFEGLYVKHYPKVYRICLRMTKNVAEAEDLTQEVFMHLHKKLASFRGESLFSTWLHRLTVNLVLMHFRKQSVRCETVAQGDDIRKLAERKPSAMYGDAGVPIANRISKELKKALMEHCVVNPSIITRMAIDNALDKLPPGYKTMIIRHDIEGYERNEIAELEGCRPGTTASQLFKARRKMRVLLNK